MVKEGSRKLVAFMTATVANVGGLFTGFIDSDAFSAIQQAALIMFGAGNFGEHISKSVGKKWES